MDGPVHVLNTGGTISHAAPGEGGATLTYSPDRILADLGDEAGAPGGIAYCEIFRKGSVSMAPADWQAIAAAVYEAVVTGAGGVVVLHGTDTMAYTAPALSFMLASLPVPVAITGSMLPGGRPDSDGRRNLRDALRVAAAGDLAEVCIVFSGDAAGSRGVILRGNRTRKRDSGALDAFASPNHPALGTVHGAAIRYDAADRVPRGRRGDPALRAEIDPRVVLLRYHPGWTPPFVEECLGRAEGAVIEGTGLGHLPPEGGILEAIAASGKPIVLVTQCWQGGVRHGMYDIDRPILAVPNLIPGHDLTPEAALTKLMWVLGRERAAAGVRLLMQRPLAGELTPPPGAGA